MLEAAGAKLFATACGACAGYGCRFGPNLNIISSIARNFKGRMGDSRSNVYLGSPKSRNKSLGAVLVALLPF